MARQIIDRTLKLRCSGRMSTRDCSGAVSEACTNVVTQATGATGYEIVAESEGSDVVITVEDDGVSADQLPFGMPPAEAVAGQPLDLASPRYRRRIVARCLQPDP